MTSAAQAEPRRFVTPATWAAALCAAAARAAERAGAEAPPELLGTWVGELGGRMVVLELRPSGTYLLAGSEGGWSARGGQLELDDQPFGYRLDGDRLRLTDLAGQTVGWGRAR